MSTKQFIVTDRVTLDYPTYVAFSGATYNEKHLREWANDRWGTPIDASLDVIARDIQHGGWMMFEYTVPADPDPAYTKKPYITSSEEAKARQMDKLNSERTNKRTAWKSVEQNLPEEEEQDAKGS